MVGTIIEPDLDIHHGVTRQHPLLHRLHNTRLHRRNEGLGDWPTHDGVLKDEALSPGKRLDLNETVTKLSPTPALLLVPPLSRGPLADGLPIGHLGWIQVYLYTKPALHSVQNDLHMHLTSTRDHQLLGLPVQSHLHGRIFFTQASQRLGDLLFPALLLRCDREGYGRRRELVGWNNDQPLLIRQSIARLGIFELG